MDLKGGYKLVLPPRWMPFAMSEEDFAQFQSEGLEQFPEMDEALVEFFAENAAAEHRLFAVDTDPDHVIAASPPIVFLGFQEDPSASGVPMDFFITVYAQTFDQLIPDLIVSDSGVKQSASGIDVGVVQIAFLMTNEIGVQQNIIQKHAFFTTEAGIAFLIMTFMDEIEEEMGPPFEALIESIEVNGQLIGLTG